MLKRQITHLTGLRTGLLVGEAEHPADVPASLAFQPRWQPGQPSGGLARESPAQGAVPAGSQQAPSPASPWRDPASAGSQPPETPASAAGPGPPDAGPPEPRGRATGQSPDPRTPARPGRGQRLAQEGSEARALLWPDAGVQQTPEKAQRFRKYGGVEPGRSRSASHGVMPPPDNRQRFGKPTQRENVGDVLKTQGWAGSDGALQEMREAVYESNRREPLGCPYVRGFQPPRAIEQDPEFRLGRRLGHEAVRGWGHLAQEGKDVISPAGGSEDPRAHELYVRSHQAFAPGEQLTRRYAWPAEIGNDWAFGKAPQRRHDEGGRNTDCVFLGEEEAIATRVLQLTAERLHEAAHPPLGRALRSYQGPLPVAEGFSFGVPPKKDCATAADAISGGYSLEAQMPDSNVGRCVRRGRTNVTTETRAFGLASGAGVNATQDGAIDSRPLPPCGMT